MNASGAISRNDLAGKRVIVRTDFNVPIEDGVVLDDARIRNTLQTISFLRSTGAKVVILSHMGRSGAYASQLSLRQVLTIAEHVYQDKITFIEDCLDTTAQKQIDRLPSGSIVLMENVRFYQEESKCDSEFGAKLASLGDFYINEAFPVSHRQHASMVEIPKHLPHAFGFSFLDEIKSIDSFFERQDRPKICIIGGSKLATKVTLLKNMVQKVDKIALGGGIAGAFLSHFGNSTFRIFNPKGYADEVAGIVENAKKHNCELIMPVDFSALIHNNDNLGHAIISSGDGSTSIFDIGPGTVKLFEKQISESKMVMWNGPVGLFERSPFDFGTKKLANYIARLTREGKITSIIGGGDTGSAMKKFGVEKDISYLSTAGGAFLMYVEGTRLPAIAAMEDYPTLYKLVD